MRGNGPPPEVEEDDDDDDDGADLLDFGRSGLLVLDDEFVDDGFAVIMLDARA